MTVNIGDIDQENSVIEVTASRQEFLQGKGMLSPRVLRNLLYHCLLKGGICGLSDTTSGLDCRLMADGVWQKGKLKLTLQFVPSELLPDELDTIRNQQKQ
jgi:hypothetical protein